MKGQHIRGICSEKYHGVIYTDDALYTFGSNGGQLGKFMYTYMYM